MRRWFVVFVVALAALWCSILSAQDGKVYKVWPEAEKVVQKSWRPVVAVFVQQGDTQFMGSSSSVMSDKKLKKILKYLVLVQIDLIKKGTDENLGVADDKNNGLMSKLLGQAKTLPIFVVAGPDMKPVKVWEQADPAVVKGEIGEILVKAIKQYDPLDDAKVKKAEGLLKRAAKEEEEGSDEKAAKTLREVVRMNKDCSLARQAQEMIDRLKGEKEDPGLIDPDEENGEDEEKKEEKKPVKPSKTYALIKTDFGDIKIELLLEKAPKTCEHFINMAKNGIFDGAAFSYIERGKLVQCIPGEKKKLPDEVDADFSDEKHEPGAVAMAHGSGSRKIKGAFYIALTTIEERDGEYAIFGKVKKGLMVAKTIGSSKTMNNKPLNKITVHKIVIEE